MLFTIILTITLCVLWPVSMGTTLGIKPTILIKSEGENATFHCTVNNIQNPDYGMRVSWKKVQNDAKEVLVGFDANVNEQFKNTQRYRLTSGEEGNTIRYTLHLIDLTPAETGKYGCFLDEMTVQYARLVVEKIDTFTFASIRENFIKEKDIMTYYFKLHETGRFECNAVSLMTIKLNIFHGEQNITKDFDSLHESDSTGEEGLRSTLYNLTLYRTVTFENRQKWHLTHLTCKVILESGVNISKTIVFRVADKPRIQCKAFSRSAESLIKINCNVSSDPAVTADDITWSLPDATGVTKKIEMGDKCCQANWNPATNLASLQISDADLKHDSFIIQAVNIHGSTSQTVPLPTKGGKGANTGSTTGLTHLMSHCLLLLCCLVIHIWMSQ